MNPTNLRGNRSKGCTVTIGEKESTLFIFIEVYNGLQETFCFTGDQLGDRISLLKVWESKSSGGHITGQTRTHGIRFKLS